MISVSNSPIYAPKAVSSLKTTFYLDENLKAKFHELSKAETTETVLKVIAYVTAFIPVIGWIVSYWAFTKLDSVETDVEMKKKAYSLAQFQTSSDLEVSSVSESISKDFRREAQVVLKNGTESSEFAITDKKELPFDHFEKIEEANKRIFELQSALQSLEISSSEVLTTLDRSHQGTFADISFALSNELVTLCNKKPLIQAETADEHGNTIYSPLSKSGRGKVSDYYLDTFAFDKGNRTTHKFKNGHIVTSAKARAKVFVIDRSLPLDHQKRVIFEYLVSFSIHSNSSRVEISCKLDKSHSIVGSIPS